MRIRLIHRSLFSSLIILMMFGYFGQAKATEKVVEVDVNVAVILSSPIVSDDGKLPSTLHDLALPFQDSNLCGTAVFRSNVTIMRADFTTFGKLEPLLPGVEKSIFDKFAEFIGKRLSFDVLVKRINERLDMVHIPKDWSKEGDNKGVSLVTMLKYASEKGINIKFVLLTEGNEKDSQIIESEVPKSEKATRLFVVKNIDDLHKQTLEVLCESGKTKANLGQQNIAVIYHPLIVPPPCTSPECLAPCQDQSRMTEASQIVKSSKRIGGRVQRNAYLEKALGIYDEIVKKCQAEGVECPTKALMNRGVINSLLGKKSALDDLLQAEKCNGKDAEVLYNLACLYSKDSSTSSSNNPSFLALSLQKLEQAKDSGFNNCEVFKNETDLNNLRKIYPSEFNKLQTDIQAQCK